MKFYAASKVWHAPTWRDLRAELEGSDIEITSRWIDYADDSDIVQNRKGELWQHCLEDVLRADAMILFCENFGEEQRGALIEAGHAMAAGKPVVCMNTCKTLTAQNGLSDVAFTHHQLFMWANPERSGDWWLTFDEGIDAAIDCIYRNNTAIISAYS